MCRSGESEWPKIQRKKDNCCEIVSKNRRNAAAVPVVTRVSFFLFFRKGNCRSLTRGILMPTVKRIDRIFSLCPPLKYMKKKEDS